MKFILIYFILFNFIIFSSCHIHKHAKLEKTTKSFFENNEDDTKFDNEVLFGSKYNNFNDLLPDEAKKALKNLIKKNKIDSNNDAFIDLNELKDWVEKSFKSLVIENSLEQFQEEDTNSDEKISWDEHLKENFNLNSVNNEEEMILEDLTYWKKADLNNDNFLDKDEFPAFSAPENFPLMYDTLYDVVMHKKDLNKDGFLSLEEYLMNEKKEKPDINTESFLTDKDKFINDLDLNKNNLLEKEEVLKWIIPDNNEIALEEAKHLIQNCDENNDGKLTLDEILNNYEHFISSESTDYGEKLKKIHDEL